MTTERQNFIMYKDADKELEIEIEDVESLVGANLVWKMGKHLKSKSLIEKRTEDMEINDNSVVVSITPEDNKDIKSGDYYHELRLTINNKTKPVLVGKVEVKDTLTSS